MDCDKKKTVTRKFIKTPLCGTCEVTTTNTTAVTRVIFTGTGCCYGSVTFLNCSELPVTLRKNNDPVNTLTLEPGCRLTLANDSICKLEAIFDGPSAGSTWSLCYKGCICCDLGCSCAFDCE